MVCMMLKNCINVTLNLNRITIFAARALWSIRCQFNSCKWRHRHCRGQGGIYRRQGRVGHYLSWELNNRTPLPPTVGLGNNLKEIPYNLWPRYRTTWGDADRMGAVCITWRWVTSHLIPITLLILISAQLRGMYRKIDCCSRTANRLTLVLHVVYFCQPCMKSMSSY